MRAYLRAHLIFIFLTACQTEGSETVWDPPDTFSGGQSGTGAVGSGGAPGGGGVSSGGESGETGGVPANTGGAGGGVGSGGDPQASTGGTVSGGSGGHEAVGGSGGGAQGTGCREGEYLLCDGFEDGQIDPTRFSVHKGESADIVEVTMDQAARGTYSVHISTQNGYGYLKNESAFPVPENDYFGRMFLRVAKFSQVDWAHWTIAEAAGEGDGSLIRVGGQFDTTQQANRWGVGSDGGPTGDWTNHDADPAGAVQSPKEGEWVCVEWEHRGSANETHFFVDGEEHPSLATTATDHGGNNVDYVLPTMKSLWFGWYQYQDDPDLRFEVWIDELAIDDERIGCD